MGRTIWCDVCQEELSSDRWVYLTVTIQKAGTPANGYNPGGKVFALDVHEECADGLVEPLEELQQNAGAS